MVSYIASLQGTSHSLIVSVSEIASYNYIFNMKCSLIAIAVVSTLASVQYASADCRFNNRAGTVYIIQETGTNYYKIGGTGRTVNQRISELQVGNPRELIERESFPVNNCRRAEERAQQMAANAQGTTRVSINRRATEWFRVTNYQNFRSRVEQATAGSEEVKSQMDLEEMIKELLLKMSLQ